MYLPFSSALEVYKFTKVRALMTVKQSRDPKVSQAGAEIRTVRKWIAAHSLKAAESQRLHKKDCTGHQGLGYKDSRLQDIIRER